MVSLAALAQSASSSSSDQHPSQETRGTAHPRAEDSLDPGSVRDGVYRNVSLGFMCKIPLGWVLRTEEINAREEAREESGENQHSSQNQGDVGHPAGNATAGSKRGNSAAVQQQSRAALDRTAEGGCPHMACGRVLLAAFSRPPEARGEDVNAAILIAAESAAVYPGLKEAAQYLAGPVTEVAKTQGFTVVEEPYEFAAGAKKLARGDFRKNVGTRVMRQSTLVMLARGYVVSSTFIGGTDDEVEELVGGLSLGK
jgi:hypothetical protein